MKPLNAKERTRAFWRFLLFYFFTLLAVVAVVIPGFRIPSIQNKILKSQMDAYERQKLYNSTFSTLLASVNDFEKDSQSGDQNDGKIKQGMLGMQTYADNDSIGVKGFYTDVIHVLTDVQNNNQQVRIANGKLAYLQALMLRSNKVDKDLAKSQKEMSKGAPKQAAGAVAAATETAVKTPEIKAVDYNAKLTAMLDSVIKFKQPAMERFNAYLCYGINTLVIVNGQKEHTFKQLYNELKQHKKSTIVDVKAEVDKNCVKSLNIKWKNNAFLGSDKLF